MNMGWDKIIRYSLMRDIAALQQKPHSPASEFKHSPLVRFSPYAQSLAELACALFLSSLTSRTAQVVLNNFKGAEESVKLMAVIFQKMFPPINVKKAGSSQLLRGSCQPNRRACADASGGL